jgi:hypothetical protein
VSLRYSKYVILIIVTTLIFSFISLQLIELLISNIKPLSHTVISLYIEHLKTALKILPIFVMILIFLQRVNYNNVLNKIKLVIDKNKIVLLVFLALFFIFTNIISYFAYFHLPQLDATWVFFQTKIFATGNLFAPAPQLPEFFPSNIIVHNNKWFSYTSPGHSLILLPFYFLKVAWVTGPILGTLTIFLIYKIAMRLFDRKVALLSLFLATFSPFMLFLFASYDFHTSSLLFSTLAIYLTIMIDNNRRLIPIFLGISLGLVFLSRPYTGLVISLVIVLYLLLTKKYKIIPLVVIGFLPFLVFHLYYNYRLTDNCLITPYGIVNKTHALGFSKDIGMATYDIKGHNIIKALINLCYNIFTLSFQLYGWLFFSLIFFILSFWLKKKKESYLLYAIFFSLLLFHFFYWFHGVTPWGVKYVTEALPALIILSALTIIYSTKLSRSFKTTFIMVAIIYNLIFFIPKTFLFFAKGKWGENSMIYNTVKNAGIKNAIIFIKESDLPNNFEYRSGFNYNEPFLKSDLIFAVDLGEKNHLLLNQYSNKKRYIFDCETNTLNYISK